MAFSLRRPNTAEKRVEEVKEIKKLSRSADTLDFNMCRVCITGTIPGKTRSQATKELLVRFPDMKPEDSVTTYTDYLITGFGVGQSKLTKAKTYGTKIIDASKVFTS